MDCEVSIRAPRAGRNGVFQHREDDRPKFQSAPRERGEIDAIVEPLNWLVSFNPRPASGAKSGLSGAQGDRYSVSIRAPRAGRNKKST